MYVPDAAWMKIDSTCGTVPMSRPVIVEPVIVATLSLTSPESSTVTWSVPAPPSIVSSAVIWSTSCWSPETVTESFPAPVAIEVGPATVFTRTLSLPTPVVMFVAPACVDSTVSVSLPEPSATLRTSRLA